MSANQTKGQALLEIRAIGIRFGGLKAVDNFTMNLYPGELVGLIGPNGAGKTTCFNMLTGVYQPTSGAILLNGRSLLGLRPFEICHRGVTRTFQNIRLFKRLTVLDNVLIAMHQRPHYNLATTVLRLPRYFENEDRMRKEALELLEIFELDLKCDHVSSALPYGEQRKLEIIRALGTKPKLILLDEPAAGMNHSETAGLMHTIGKIRQEFGLTVLLIEHDMPLVMGICERIFVLDHGVTIAEGDAKAIQNNPKVIEAYLGVAEEEA